ncbi:MAG: helix-turn-helix transcriptional regulator [Chitinophagaceae bacterium]|nr:helix-turn-helix transcriptional regulator [Chitinophagaceae bacterium]
MNNSEGLYSGCPVQHARQFIAGKWQMGILWNLRNQSLSFSEIKRKLPGLSDKILMQELDFFVEKKIIDHNIFEFQPAKTEYALSSMGRSLIPVINSIVEWGYLYLQDEQFSSEMSLTPLAAIEAIERGCLKKNKRFVT